MEREAGGKERVFWENKNPTQDVGKKRGKKKNRRSLTERAPPRVQGCPAGCTHTAAARRR
eukprot:7629010-Pyramimonas_sp.AAC.1